MLELFVIVCRRTENNRDTRSTVIADPHPDGKYGERLTRRSLLSVLKQYTKKILLNIGRWRY